MTQTPKTPPENITPTSPRPDLTTTLNRIRVRRPCEDGWTKLLAGLGKTKADDKPLPFATILDINGLNDALWCCRAEIRTGTWREHPVNPDGMEAAAQLRTLAAERDAAIARAETAERESGALSAEIEKHIDRSIAEAAMQGWYQRAVAAEPTKGSIVWLASWLLDQTETAEARVKTLREALEPLLAAAVGLSHGVDWNKGTHAIIHRHRQSLLDAVPAARAAMEATDDA